MFVFDLDRKTEIVHCRTRGFWNTDDATRFVEAFRAITQQARSQFGHLKILIDSRDMPIQHAKVSERFVGLDRELLELPEDRFGILVSSSLLKMQAQRALTSDRSKVFVSENAARTWLLAFVTHDHKHGSPCHAGARHDPPSSPGGPAGRDRFGR